MSIVFIHIVFSCQAPPQFQYVPPQWLPGAPTPGPQMYGQAYAQNPVYYPVYTHHDPVYAQDENSSYENSASGSEDFDYNDDNLSNCMIGQRDEKRLQGFKVLFQNLSSKFPDKFQIRNLEGPYYEARHREAGGMDNNVPSLLIKPVLTGSWLDPPFKAYPNDIVKFWDDSITFPTKSHVNPKEYRFAAKKACPYVSFEDEALGAFIKGQPFKKISLDTAAFDVSSVELSNAPSSKIDALLRPALRDSFVNDEILQMLLGLVGSLEPFLRGDDESSRILDLIFSCLETTAENNQRSGQAILASIVTNRLSMRDSVLRRFQVPKYTKTILKGSDFKSDKLFGPLPESFKASLLTHTGKALRCTTKKRFPSSFNSSSSVYPSTSSKRPSFSSTPAAKRTKRGGSSSRFFRGKSLRKK